MSEVKQVGGTHYKTSGDQHWDLIDRYDIPYLEATASKYVVRWRKKNGVEDLEKAVSYLEKVRERNSATRSRLVPIDALASFCEENNMGWVEVTILHAILCDDGTHSINYAIQLIKAAIDIETLEIRLAEPQVTPMCPGCVERRHDEAANNG